jgi:GDP-mannose 4,6-dehydratase
MKRKILITGINGSGSSYLAEYILENIKNVSIHGTTRGHGNVHYKNLQKVQKDIDIIYVDLCDFSSVYRTFDNLRPDVVFHIASMANVKSSFESPLIVINNNVNITLNILEVVRMLKDKYGYNPIVQICSTSEVYGQVDPKHIPITEDCPINPINPYAVSKLTQDALGHVYYLNNGLNVIRTRMFSYLNARRGDLFATAFARQILDIKNGKRNVLEHGNLKSVRTLIDVRDAAESYWISIEKCKVGEVYNIGGTTPIKIEDFLNLLIDKFDVEVKTVENKNFLRPSDISVQIPDITKFTKCTGWKPKISFNDGLDFFVKEVYKFWDK